MNITLKINLPTANLEATGITYISFLKSYAFKIDEDNAFLYKLSLNENILSLRNEQNIESYRIVFDQPITNFTTSLDKNDTILTLNANIFSLYITHNGIAQLMAKDIPLTNGLTMRSYPGVSIPVLEVGNIPVTQLPNYYILKFYVPTIFNKIEKMEIAITNANNATSIATTSINNKLYNAQAAFKVITERFIAIFNNEKNGLVDNGALNDLNIANQLQNTQLLNAKTLDLNSLLNLTLSIDDNVIKINNDIAYVQDHNNNSIGFIMEAINKSYLAFTEFNCKFFGTNALSTGNIGAAIPICSAFPQSCKGSSCRNYTDPTKNIMDRFSILSDAVATNAAQTYSMPVHSNITQTISDYFKIAYANFLNMLVIDCTMIHILTGNCSISNIAISEFEEMWNIFFTPDLENITNADIIANMFTNFMVIAQIIFDGFTKAINENYALDIASRYEGLTRLDYNLLANFTMYDRKKLLAIKESLFSFIEQLFEIFKNGYKYPRPGSSHNNGFYDIYSYFIVSQDTINFLKLKLNEFLNIPYIQLALNGFSKLNSTEFTKIAEEAFAEFYTIFTYPAIVQCDLNTDSCRIKGDWVDCCDTNYRCHFFNHALICNVNDSYVFKVYLSEPTFCPTLQVTQYRHFPSDKRGSMGYRYKLCV